MCRKHHIQPYYTAVEFQRENPVERKVAELKNTLRSLLTTEQRKKNWDKYLPQALGILRSRKNRATGQTTEKALLGYNRAKQGQWEIPEFREQQRERTDARLRRREIRVRQLDFQRHNYPPPEAQPSVTFQPGDMVMLKRTQRVRDPFGAVWERPYTVVRRLSPELYEIDPNGRQFSRHVDQLRPAPPRNPTTPTTSDSESDDELDLPPERILLDEEDRRSENSDELPVAHTHGRTIVQETVRLAAPGVDQGPPKPGTSGTDPGTSALRRHATAPQPTTVSNYRTKMFYRQPNRQRQEEDDSSGQSRQPKRKGNTTAERQASTTQAQRQSHQRSVSAGVRVSEDNSEPR